MRNEERLDDFLDKFQPQDAARVRDARAWAAELHAGALRVSGEPVVTHPERVAAILAGMGLDADSVVTGLLHQAMEDGLVGKAGDERDAERHAEGRDAARGWGLPPWRLAVR